MTEERIERQVERTMDYLDKRYLAGTLTEDEYHAKIKEIDAWAESQYAINRKPHATAA